MQKDWRIQDLLEWTREYFQNHDIAEPRLEAEVLLAFALNLNRVGLYVQYDRPVNADERAHFRELIKRRASHEPTAYIVGQREFMSMNFKVDERVLVPRPDTEVLVEEAIQILRKIEGPVTAVDVGTGSGAIAVSLARYVPQAVVYAVDVEPGALALASENAAANGVQDRVIFERSDLLTGLSVEKVHLIAANLPYIPEQDMSGLPAEVKNYEPHLALNGGPDGIVYYSTLMRQAVSQLQPQGSLLMEIADRRQGDLLMAQAGGDYGEYRVLNDLGGRERVLVMKRGAE